MTLNEYGKHFRFYFFKKNEYANKKELTMDEVKKLITEAQITEAYEAKLEDAYEQVTYMVKGGFVTLE